MTFREAMADIHGRITAEERELFLREFRFALFFFSYAYTHIGAAFEVFRAASEEYGFDVEDEMFALICDYKVLSNSELNFTWTWDEIQAVLDREFAGD